MSENKTEIDCHLTTHGTDKANARVVDDLAVPDPEPAVGKQMIEEIMEEESDNGDKPTSP